MGVGVVVTSENLYGVMVRTRTRNAGDVGSNPVLSTVFPIFITPTTLVAVTMIPYKLCTVWLLNLPCVYMYVCEVTACMYALVNIKRLTIPGRRV